MKFSRRNLFVAAVFGVGTCLLLPSIGRSQGPRKAQGFRLPGRLGDLADKVPTVVFPTPVPVQRATTPDAGGPRVVATRPPGLPSAVATNPPMLLSDMDKMNRRIAALEAKIADQQKTIDSLSKTVHARPAGYSKAFITLGSISSLSPKDAITYWARTDNNK
ncbi:hypothetical protein EON83_24065 [bacterium]|nr:MAG: hypothetical protein EON83_24065 [bacterium]